MKLTMHEEIQTNTKQDTIFKTLNIETKQKYFNDTSSNIKVTKDKQYNRDKKSRTTDAYINTFYFNYDKIIHNKSHCRLKKKSYFTCNRILREGSVCIIVESIFLNKRGLPSKSDERIRGLKIEIKTGRTDKYRRARDSWFVTMTCLLRNIYFDLRSLCKRIQRKRQSLHEMLNLFKKIMCFNGGNKSDIKTNNARSLRNVCTNYSGRMVFCFICQLFVRTSSELWFLSFKEGYFCKQRLCQTNSFRTHLARISLCSTALFDWSCIVGKSYDHNVPLYITNNVKIFKFDLNTGSFKCFQFLSSNAVSTQRLPTISSSKQRFFQRTVKHKKQFIDSSLSVSERYSFFQFPQATSIFCF